MYLKFKNGENNFRIIYTLEGFIWHLKNLKTMAVVKDAFFEEKAVMVFTEKSQEVADEISNVMSEIEDLGDEAKSKFKDAVDTMKKSIKKMK